MGGARDRHAELVSFGDDSSAIMTDPSPRVPYTPLERRTFVAMIFDSLLGSPLAVATAQPPEKVPRVGS